MHQKLANVSPHILAGTIELSAPTGNWADLRPREYLRFACKWVTAPLAADLLVQVKRTGCFQEDGVDHCQPSAVDDTSLESLS